MSPFLDDSDDDYVEVEVKREDERSSFFNNEKRYFVVGCIAAVVAFVVIGYVLYFNSSPVDLEELPVIKAETTPFKVKPSANEQVKHQDKTVYDNISGSQRVVAEKIITPAEETVTVPEVSVEETLSDEEKNNIIKAFDELASKSESRLDVVKTQPQQQRIRTEQMTIVEEKTHLPPLHQVKKNEKKEEPAHKKQRLKDVVSSMTSVSKTPYDRAGIMVQVASVASKASAEMEYKRVLRKNSFLKKFGKKIFKVDLGVKKGTKYRVQVGPFKNRNEAKKTVASLNENGFAAYISK